MPAFAVEFTSGDFKANIYGNIYADGFYTYSYSSDKAEPLFSSLSMSNGKHSFGSYAFVGSSNFGVTMSYQNVSGTIGLSQFQDHTPPKQNRSAFEPANGFRAKICVTGLY